MPKFTLKFLGFHAMPSGRLEQLFGVSHGPWEYATQEEADHEAQALASHPLIVACAALARCCLQEAISQPFDVGYIIFLRSVFKAFGWHPSPAIGIDQVVDGPD